MFVVFNLRTGYTGEDVTEVYDVDNDLTDDELDVVGEELAENNCSLHSRYDFSHMSYSWERRPELTENEVIDIYGDYRYL